MYQLKKNFKNDTIHKNTFPKYVPIQIKHIFKNVPNQKEKPLK